MAARLIFSGNAPSDANRGYLRERQQRRAYRLCWFERIYRDWREQGKRGAHFESGPRHSGGPHEINIRRAPSAHFYTAIFVGVKTFLGSGWRRLLPPVPVTQCREQKDRRHSGQSANDKENAVGVNEAVRGAQVFDRSTGKSLQDLSQPGIG